MDTYSTLCDEFIKVSRDRLDSVALNDLKLHFSREIDSKRTLGYIQTLEWLIRILEKRDILRCDCIEPLKYISKEFIKDSIVESKLIRYEILLQNIHFPIYNSYANSKVEAVPSTSISSDDKYSNSNVGQCPTTGFMQPQFPQAGYQAYSNAQPFYLIQAAHLPSHIQYQAEIPVKNSSNTCSNKEKKLQDEVLFCVSDKLGRHWRDVARLLEIRECDIDTIESKFHFDLKEKALQSLKVFVSQSDPQYWKTNLMHALDKARRRDLKEMVEEMLTLKE